MSLAEIEQRHTRTDSSIARRSYEDITGWGDSRPPSQCYDRVGGVDLRGWVVLKGENDP